MSFFSRWRNRRKKKKPVERDKIYLTPEESSSSSGRKLAKRPGVTIRVPSKNNNGVNNGNVNNLIKSGGGGRYTRTRHGSSNTTNNTHSTNSTVIGSELKSKLNKIETGDSGYKLYPNKPTKSKRLIAVGDNFKQEERGALVVTHNEANQLKNSTLPYWELKSSNERDLITESHFAGSVRQTSRPIRTRGTFEFNTANIIEGKEQFNQYKKIISEFEKKPESFANEVGVTTNQKNDSITYSLNNEYFDKNIDNNKIRKDSLINAKNKFKSLSTNKRIGLNLNSFAISVTQGVLGLGEMAGTFATNMGVQTFKKEDFGKSRNFHFGSNTIAGRIISMPSVQSTTTFRENPLNYIKQKGLSSDTLGKVALFAPMIADGVISTVKGVRAYGLKTGLSDTLSGFSPLRLKNGIYAESISKSTKLKITSAKNTKNGVTNRAYSGSPFGESNIKLSGFEKTSTIKGKTIGGGLTTTENPYIKISGGGSGVDTGIINTINSYEIGNLKTGTGFLSRGTKDLKLIKSELKGGSSISTISKGSTIYTSDNGVTIFSNPNKGYKIRTGSLGTEKNGVTSFVSGRTKPIYKTIFDVGTKSDFIRKPSGKFKINPKTYGKEYDLDVLSSNTESRIGEEKIPHSNFANNPSNSGSVLKIKIGTKKMVTPIISDIKPLQINSQPSLILPKNIKTQNQKLYPSIVTPTIKSEQKRKRNQKFKQTSPPIIKQTFKPTSKPTSPPQKRINPIKSKLFYNPIQNNRIWGNIPILSPIISKASVSGRAGIKNRLFKYTPSFTALKFGIFSNKQSKGIKYNKREIYSGFETRAVIRKKHKKKTKKNKKKNTNKSKKPSFFN